ncbi:MULTISPECIES: WhiB family transcriptional regulator [unclassified Rhodococcus (in: high G+C Gram-positive bacteria)]|uniref:WhiB family transcriptional regulator n=1 Tax=unclassified Rhodococcus (in: high G+C Gram-positive bacteria) TaxID=192944 RepID=UPI0006FC5D37|nr:MULTISPECIES: WhiB family transcriptional regulator [unclassified Rhodococcus (in: high G+C Gram-positive bacteria)]KQU30313.1 hypothetical protein ASG69_04445 [Rhodococcus sp. Leaf225]KQU44782.1 hypothetical protein ASH03_12695 [Rhodococcus sp. Leaf258]
MRTISRPRHPFETITEAAQQDWVTLAKCADGDLDSHFPREHIGRLPEDRRKHLPNPAVDDAKNVCAACPVIRQCARRALDTHAQHGVWAGILLTSTGEGRVTQLEELSRLAKQVA